MTVLLAGWSFATSSLAIPKCNKKVTKKKLTKVRMESLSDVNIIITNKIIFLIKLRNLTELQFTFSSNPVSKLLQEIMYTVVHK